MFLTFTSLLSARPSPQRPATCGTMPTPASSYIGVGVGDEASRGLATAAAARDALRALASTAVAERELAIAERDEAASVTASLRADVMTLRAKLAEANERCAARGERPTGAGARCVMTRRKSRGGSRLSVKHRKATLTAREGGQCRLVFPVPPFTCQNKKHENTFSCHLFSKLNDGVRESTTTT